MSFSVDYIVKLGGAAITDKTCLECADLDAIDAAAAVIKKSGQTCIAVHGAGSFGHFQASEFGTVGGFGSSAERSREGFARTRSSVTKLLNIVVDRFISAGIPAVGLSLCGVWETENRKLVISPTAAIERALQTGFLPVLHGDCVFDRALGFTILGGDMIIQRLADVFQPPRVVFLTNTDGIFDRPPEEEGARLLNEVAVDEQGEMLLRIQSTQLAHDVTGGVRSKLMHAAAIVSKSMGKTKVLVARLKSDDALRACLEGRGVCCTAITFQPSKPSDDS